MYCNNKSPNVTAIYITKYYNITTNIPYITLK